jgi:DNA gyrase subunit B
MTKDEKKKKGSEYGAKSIQVLEGLDPVRKRPGMYIGGTSTEGLHHLIWEVVNNSIDEAMAGYCNYIRIKLLPDNIVEIYDNGRGIPVEIHPQTKKSTLETVMTVLHAGGKFGGDGYKVSGGLHGVGVSVVNALSVWTKAEVYRDGKNWMQEYKRGVPSANAKPIGKSDKTGTTISFQADPQIFPEIKYSWTKILDYVRQQAYLTKGVKIIIEDRREVLNEEKEEYKIRRHGFYFDGGIISFVKFLNRGKEIKNDLPVYVEKTVDDVNVEISLQYTDGYKEHLYSFANACDRI